MQANEPLTARKETSKQDELLRRKELSESRAAKWPNTLQVLFDGGGRSSHCCCCCCWSAWHSLRP
jgi:hypothetical protein